jgi:hypothetical protein
MLNPLFSHLYSLLVDTDKINGFEGKIKGKIAGVGEVV